MRYGAVIGWQAEESTVAPAVDRTRPGRSPAADVLTHWPSPGLASSGKPTWMRPSSLVAPSLRTLTVSWNVCPIVIESGTTPTCALKAGAGSTGGGGGAAPPSFRQVGGSVRDRNHVSPTRPRLSVPPYTTSRSAPGS